MTERNADDQNPKVPQLRKVFAKVAKGELQPSNFGNCLLTAVNEGLSSKAAIAGFLGVEVGHIRKVGNSLKPREMASVSREIVEGYDRHIGG